ncbi:hypothetical protein G7Y89_g15660 [Cudoniella acicularis]|uniref:Uncharacterized protein n=1 Tax=Cudoniella acicularis TaxID=354080 RepID=A0A8H4VIU3_9HELO|nr:hypothetical protein G7Y89_g15660 [Cudoniella acicularis]
MAGNEGTSYALNIHVENVSRKRQRNASPKLLPSAFGNHSAMSTLIGGAQTKQMDGVAILPLRKKAKKNTSPRACDREYPRFGSTYFDANPFPSMELGDFKHKNMTNGNITNAGISSSSRVDETTPTKLSSTLSKRTITIPKSRVPGVKKHNKADNTGPGGLTDSEEGDIIADQGTAVILRPSTPERRLEPTSPPLRPQKSTSHKRRCFLSPLHGRNATSRLTLVGRSFREDILSNYSDMEDSRESTPCPPLRRLVAQAPPKALEAKGAKKGNKKVYQARREAHASRIAGFEMQIQNLQNELHRAKLDTELNKMVENMEGN